MENVYIVSSVRSAVGKAKRGSLAQPRPEDMGAQVLLGALEKVPEMSIDDIDDLLIGCAFPEAEQGMNLAQMIGLKAGMRNSLCGATVNRFCSSGLQTIAMAHQAIAFGQADIIVAGGVESMSSIEMGGNIFTPDFDLQEVYPEAYENMGNTAENVAAKYGVDREAQDAFALQSHQRALAAISDGKFKDEIVPMTITMTGFDGTSSAEKTFVFDTDEGPRADTSLEALAKLRPAFRATGGVTAGNASQVSDGAAITILISETKMKALGLKPIARLLGFTVAGVPAELMGIGPISAIPKVLNQCDLSLKDIDLIELNEAFASQSVAIVNELQLDDQIVNVNGGAISLGHPLGCTGAKLTATLLNELNRRDQRYGLCTMCVGGGMGAAGLFERIK